MAKSYDLCNVCKQPIEKHTVDTFSDHRRCGYDSQHDGDTRNLDLCASCYENELQSLSERCEMPVWVQDDCGYEDSKYGD